MRRSLVIAALSAAVAGAPAAGEIHVTNSGAEYRLSMFANGANGNAAPLRVMEGGATHLVLPSQVFADSLHGQLFVANHFANSIDVYPLGASGDQPPLRTLQGAATLLDEPTGVAVDLVHDEMVVGNFDNGHDGSITVYSRSATGNAAPLRRLIGAATGLKWVVQVAVDPVSNEIYVACQGGDSVPAGIRVFSRTANGNVAPIRTIAGFNTSIATPSGIAFDAANNEILLTDRAGAISTFARTANGNAAPLRRIAGPASTLLETWGVSLLGNGEIVATNAGFQGHDYTDDAVLVFNRNASGNVAPKRRINGPGTTLSGPHGIAVVSPKLGLRNNRFGVQAVFRTQGGAIGDGIPVQLTADTGYLWFFQAPNVEIVVKVLDGCGINNRYWVFAGGLTDVNVDLIVTDYESGRVRTYTNPQKTAFQPIQDIEAFATCPPAPLLGGGQAEEPIEPEALESKARSWRASRSVVGDTLLLNNERFEVRAEWETTVTSGVGHPVAITGDTGYFWFFNAENVEVVVKVLNACVNNTGHYWVFAGGLTDVRVRLTVTDLLRGNVRVYENPQKTPFQPIQDTSAFATCP